LSDAAAGASRPYRIAVPNAVLADLRERLGRTRWPEPIPDAGWDYGAEVDAVVPALPGFGFGSKPRERGRRLGLHGRCQAAALERDRFWRSQEAAYSRVQRTKPDSLTVAQSDSPAGLAAWMVEKFRTWSDCA
jgi:Epoxide hydrolase N terminus